MVFCLFSILYFVMFSIPYNCIYRITVYTVIVNSYCDPSGLLCFTAIVLLTDRRALDIPRYRPGLKPDITRLRRLFGWLLSSFSRRFFFLSAVLHSSPFVQPTLLLSVGCSVIFTLRLVDAFALRRLFRILRSSFSRRLHVSPSKTAECQKKKLPPQREPYSCCIR